MSNNNLWDVYEKSILELFEEAKNRNVSLFERSLVVPRYPKVVMFPDGSKRRFSLADESPEMEIAQAFVTVRTFEQAVRDDKIEKQVRTPLTLMLSFHLLEADLWHVILANLLAVIAGHDELKPNRFREKTLRIKVKRMNELLDECRQQNKTLSIHDVYQTLCNNDIIDLRNAFSHSQYLLSPGGDVALTKWFTLTRRRPASKKGQFSFNEIQDIFQRTLTFLTVLAEYRRKIARHVPIGARQS